MLSPCAEADHPTLIAKHEEVERQIDLAKLVTMRNVKHNLMGTNWKALQEKDPILWHVLAWKQPYRNLTKKEKQEINDGIRKDTRDHHTLEQYLSTCINAIDAKMYGDQQKDLVFQNNLLYLKELPKNSTKGNLLFIVPACKCQADLDLCHQDARHQGWDRTYSLLRK